MLALHESALAIVIDRFAIGGRCWSMRPGKLSGGFGLIPIPHRLGTFGEKSGASDSADFFRNEYFPTCP